MSNYEFENDELMEYCLLLHRDTGLPMACFADDGGSWEMRKHQIWFLMQNGYNVDTDEIIPFTVSEKPQIVGQYKLNIEERDIEKVKEFIKLNVDVLISLAKDEIDNITILKQLKKVE